MHITDGVNKISKTVQLNLTNVLSESSIHFTQLSIVFAKKNVGCVTVRNYAGTCKGICSYNLVYNILMQLFPLKILVFMAHFLNAFWHGKKAFPKSSSQNEIVPFLIVFHLSHSRYKGVKICFYSCRYKIKIFHSCLSCSIRVALVSLVQHSCRNLIARVSLVSHSCGSWLAFVL